MPDMIRIENSLLNYKVIRLKLRLKYGWFHVKLYLIFQDLSRRSIKTCFLADLSRGLNSI